MELISTTDATALITTVTGFITDNIAAVLVLVGFFVGLRIVTKLVNGATKGGKVRT